MNYLSIKDSLKAKLETLSLPTEHVIGESFEADALTPFYRFTFVPGQPLAATNGSDLLKGFVQISLFYPLNRGTADSYSLQQQIIDLFPRGTYVDDVRITSTYPSVVTEENGFFSTRIFVYFECFQDR